MKQGKPKKQDDRARDTIPSSPSPHYNTFMGDPRLTMFAKPKESPKKQQRRKISAKIITIVGALLALAMLAAVFIPMLREHFASLPKDLPIDPPIDPPVDLPVDPPELLPVDPPVDSPDIQPVDPPVDSPVDPPVEPEWEKAKLSFDRNHFKRKYTSAYNANLTITYVYNLFIPKL